jgi:hypothetical protein
MWRRIARKPPSAEQAALRNAHGDLEKAEILLNNARALAINIPPSYAISGPAWLAFGSRQTPGAR